MPEHPYACCPMCRKPVPKPNPVRCPNPKCNFLLHNRRRGPA